MVHGRTGTRKNPAQRSWETLGGAGEREEDGAVSMPFVGMPMGLGLHPSGEALPLLWRGLLHALGGGVNLCRAMRLPHREWRQSSCLRFQAFHVQ